MRRPIAGGNRTSVFLKRVAITTLLVWLWVLHGADLRSAPNQFGETGLIEQPMAVTLSSGEALVIIGTRYFDFTDAGDFRMSPLGLSFGVSSSVEVGLAIASYPREDVLNPGGEQSLRIHGRWRFLSDVDGRPAVALALWEENLFTVPDTGARLIVQKQINGFQLMASGGYLYHPDYSFGLLGCGFEREFVNGMDILLDVNYAYPVDSDSDRRLRGYPGLRWFFSSKIALVGTVGGGLDGNDTVMEGFLGISFTSHEAREVQRARGAEVPKEEPPEEVPEVPEEVEEPYTTPRPEFKLRIPSKELPEGVTS